MTDATNQNDLIQFVDDEPVEGVETDQDDNGVDDQAEEQGEEPEDDGSPSDDEDEYEEVERGDKRYKIPKALKEDLLRHDDYSRKTQVHAEEVRRFNERVTAFEAASDESLKAAVEAKVIRDRLSDIKALSDAEWSQIQAMDRQDGGDRYNKLIREMTTLPQKLSEAEATSMAQRDSVLKEQSEIQTKQFEQGQAVLTRDIPGWGPELGAKLASFVKDEFGIDEKRHGAAFLDPALVKMAHAAFKAKESQRKAATTKKIEQVTKNTPPKTAKSAAPQNGLRDDLPTDEWARRRNEQLAKRR